MRSRDGTGLAISIVKLRRAMLRISRVRVPQLLRLRISEMSGWRRRPRARTSKKLTCHMPLPCPGKNGWLPVRSRQIAVTLTLPVFRLEPRWKILIQAKFSLRRRIPRGCYSSSWVNCILKQNCLDLKQKFLLDVPWVGGVQICKIKTSISM
jgi:hypothetical protein